MGENTVESNSDYLKMIPFLPNARDALTIEDFLKIAVLAEIVVASNAEQPWLVEERLNKRRGVYEYDKYLQNLLLFLDKKDGINAYCIECGNSSYYKSEICINGNNYLHFHHSFSSSAKYNQRYLLMNKNDSVRYAYFLYSLNAEKNKIESLKFIVPSENGTPQKQFELSQELHIVRESLKANRVGPNDIMKQLP